MDWLVIGVFALAALTAIGAGKLAGSLVSNEVHKKIARSSAITIVVVWFFTWFNGTIQPERKAQRVQAHLDKIVEDSTALSAIREFEPETMAEVRDYIRKAIRENHGSADIENNTRLIIGRLIAERLPKASDAAVLYAIGLMVEQMKFLHERGDDSCFKLLFPQVDGGVRAEQVFSAELISRDYESTRLILSSYDATREDVDAETAMRNFELVYSELRESFSEADLAQLVEVAAAKVDRSKVCLISIDLYSIILAMPEADAITTLRWILR